MCVLLLPSCGAEGDDETSHVTSAEAALEYEIILPYDPDVFRDAPYDWMSIEDVWRRWEKPIVGLLPFKPSAGKIWMGYAVKPVGVSIEARPSTDRPAPQQHTSITYSFAPPELFPGHDFKVFLRRPLSEIDREWFPCERLMFEASPGPYRSPRYHCEVFAGENEPVEMAIVVFDAEGDVV